MIVREATSADVEAVGPLLLKCLTQHESWDPARYGLSADVAREYRRWWGRLAEDPRTTVLIAYEADRAMGYLVATVHRDRPIYRTGDYAVIHDLWVEDDGEEAVAQLLRAARQRFSAAGATQLRAATAASNERARQLLQRSGFRICQIDLLLELPPPKPRKSAAKGGASQSTPSPRS